MARTRRSRSVGRIGIEPGKLELLRAKRRAMTPAEQALWEAVRGSAIGARVRRQHPVLGFQLDFYVPELRLAIEVDGDVHHTIAEYDEERSSILARHGVTVVRIPNSHVLPNVSIALAQIREAIQQLRMQPSAGNNAHTTTTPHNPQHRTPR